MWIIERPVRCCYQQMKFNTDTFIVPIGTVHDYNFPRLPARISKHSKNHGLEAQSQDTGVRYRQGIGLEEPQVAVELEALGAKLECYTLLRKHEKEKLDKDCGDLPRYSWNLDDLVEENYKFLAKSGRRYCTANAEWRLLHLWLDFEIISTTALPFRIGSLAEIIWKCYECRFWRSLCKRWTFVAPISKLFCWFIGRNTFGCPTLEKQEGWLQANKFDHSASDTPLFKSSSTEKFHRPLLYLDLPSSILNVHTSSRSSTTALERTYTRHYGRKTVGIGREVLGVCGGPRKWFVGRWSLGWFWKFKEGVTWPRANWEAPWC